MLLSGREDDKIFKKSARVSHIRTNSFPAHRQKRKRLFLFYAGTAEHIAGKLHL